MILLMWSTLSSSMSFCGWIQLLWMFMQIIFTYYTYYDFLCQFPLQKKQKKLAKLPNGNHEGDPFNADNDGDVERIARELEAKYVSWREREGCERQIMNEILSVCVYYNLITFLFVHREVEVLTQNRVV